MSKENAEKFLDDVNTNEGLKKTLLDAAANAQAWIASAATAGYQMTADELRAAAEAVVGKPVSADQLIGTLRGLFEGELNDGSLDAVTGGAGVAQRKIAPQPLKVNTVAVGGGMQPGGSQMSPTAFTREGGPIGIGFDPGAKSGGGGP
jgi:predicted ribosomally synthesized peptide with nif11-like leader